MRRLSDKAILVEKKKLAETERWYVFHESSMDGSTGVAGPMTLGDARWLANKIAQDNNWRVRLWVTEPSKLNWQDALEERHMLLPLPQEPSQ